MPSLRLLLDCVSGEFDEASGYEVYAFHVAKYNDKVADVFKLPCRNDRSVGLLVLSTPAMFTHEFRPWLAERYAHATKAELKSLVKDPLDEMMQGKADRVVAAVAAERPSAKVDVRHDFSLQMPYRRPLVLMPTCGHVAGAATYYQVADVSPASPAAVDLKERLGDLEVRSATAVPHHISCFRKSSAAVCTRATAAGLRSASCSCLTGMTTTTTTTTQMRQSRPHCVARMPIDG